MPHALHQIAGVEALEHVGPGADRLQVGRRLPRFRAAIRLEQVLRDDHAVLADERIGPERRRLVEQDADGVVVDLLDLDVVVAARRHRRGRGIARILPVEHHVIGGEVLAVVPLDALLQLPDDGPAVFGDAAVLHARNLGREHRDEIAIRVPARERLVEQARAVLILGAGREMRIEQRRSLPPQQLERAAAARFRRRVGRRRFGHRDAADRQELIGQRRRQPDRRHASQESASGKAPGLHPLDRATKLVRVHSVSIPASGSDAPRREALCDPFVTAK